MPDTWDEYLAAIESLGAVDLWHSSELKKIDTQETRAANATNTKLAKSRERRERVEDEANKLLQSMRATLSDSGLPEMLPAKVSKQTSGTQTDVQLHIQQIRKLVRDLDLQRRNAQRRREKEADARRVGLGQDTDPVAKDLPIEASNENRKLLWAVLAIAAVVVVALSLVL